MKEKVRYLKSYPSKSETYPRDKLMQEQAFQQLVERVQACRLCPRMKAARECLDRPMATHWHRYSSLLRPQDAWGPTTGAFLSSPIKPAATSKPYCVPPGLNAAPSSSPTRCSATHVTNTATMP